MEADDVPEKQPPGPKCVVGWVGESVKPQNIVFLKETGYSVDLLEIHANDVALGVLQEGDERLCKDAHSRGAFRCVSKKGIWRTRAADEMTESWVKVFTRQGDMQADGASLDWCYFTSVLAARRVPRYVKKR